MNEVRFTLFGGHHTADEWDLIQSALAVGTPEAKTEYEEIDGASGSIDLTEALTGDVTYKDRTIQWSFDRIGPRDENIQALAEMRNAIHGRRMEIRLQDYPGRRFIGRVTVGDPEINTGYATVKVTAVCEPFILGETRTVSADLDKGVEVETVLRSGRKPAAPSIESTVAAKLEIGGKVYAVPVGSGYELVGLMLKQGDNPVRLFGAARAGTVTISWEWGEL